MNGRTIAYTLLESIQNMGLKRILEQLARTNPERCLNTVYLHTMLYVIMESDLRTMSSYNKPC